VIKIAQIYRAVTGAREPFHLEFKAEDFNIPEIKSDIIVEGQFMRMEEGVMMMIEKIEATQSTLCSRCAKPLKIPLEFTPSEWLFYEEKPHEDDDEDETLLLDSHRLELDPMEPVRQDLLLNLQAIPRCKKLCAKFEESKPEEEKTIKALAGLKDMLS
jgi:uncharacterized metal-binding protein YceD (DUF177 family)